MQCIQILGPAWITVKVDPILFCEKRSCVYPFLPCLHLRNLLLLFNPTLHNFSLSYYFLILGTISFQSPPSYSNPVTRVLLILKSIQVDNSLTLMRNIFLSLLLVLIISAH